MESDCGDLLRSILVRNKKILSASICITVLSNPHEFDYVEVG